MRDDFAIHSDELAIVSRRRTTLMKIVSAVEMREIDRVSSEKFAVPSRTLMENAGTAVAEFALKQYPQAKSLGVICGKGNNGGDGFVAARRLREAGKEVQVLLLADPKELKGDAAEMFRKLPESAIVAFSHEQFKSERARRIFDCDVLLDAILGTGFRPPVSGLYADAIHALNATEKPTIAVDIPSGADADLMGEQTGTVARADHIVTFTAPRPAHIFGGLTRGTTVISPIGSPDEVITSSQQMNVTIPHDFASFLAPRPAASNKGSFGHVLVIGGSRGKAGAAAMTGMSVLRTGAGLVTVATANSVLNTVAGFHPEVMTEPLTETSEGTIALTGFHRISQLAESKSVLAVGPGISRDRQTSNLVRTLIKKRVVPVVLDADGLNAFEGRAKELDGRKVPLVLTPHPGEMARLLKTTVPAVQHDRINVARKFAREHHLILVLKGHRTMVAAPDGEIWVNTTGNPGMATGGTGDILTGMVAGLIAQGPDRILEAVIAAVYLHGLAGDVARETMGEHSLVATDLVRSLPEAFRRATLAAARSTTEIHG